MGTWNYRILAHKYDKEIYFQVHEVYYDEYENPNGYTKNPISIGGTDIKEITWSLNKILACRKKPILWAGKQFPEEYK